MWRAEWVYLTKGEAGHTTPTQLTQPLPPPGQTGLTCHRRCQPAEAASMEERDDVFRVEKRRLQEDKMRGRVQENKKKILKQTGIRGKVEKTGTTNQSG